ncbi:hypothetical protein GGD83_004622 [Rhodoblastus sphagnicola]|nr:hypothetical protein [Rhodoblastus sphagnicola]MBB4200793.1 hypothetical protein [Rhodoblastus sphagnicola]
MLRHAQYQDALAEDRRFPRRSTVGFPITDALRATRNLPGRLVLLDDGL